MSMMGQPNEIIDLILERPRQIKIDGRSFRIRPLTLGKTLLLAKYNDTLRSALLKAVKDPQKALLKMCEENADVVAGLIAIYITEKVGDLFDDDVMETRRKFLLDNLTPVQMATLMELYYEEKSVDYYVKALGIDKERDKRRKAEKAKDPSSSVICGGVSLLGGFIDMVCERYGWTYQYVLWGISYNTLQTMLADVVQTVYLSDKERKRAHISTDGIVIKADDPRNADIIAKIFANN